MYRFNFNTLSVVDNLNDNDKFLILCNKDELSFFKDRLNLDDNTFRDCLTFDENIKFDILENYDFLSINSFYTLDKNIIFKEMNIYISKKYILVVCDKDDHIYSFLKDDIILNKNIFYNDYFFSVIYSIFKEIILVQFENLEKLEDIILKIEDDLVNGINDIEKINIIRLASRNIVKNTRPYLYILDKFFENNRFFVCDESSNIQTLNFSIEKLYAFSLSTRELSDKLLDIYSSNVSKKTNDLITKLTLLTAISSPLTIITGIYGMNFKVMPFLDFYYGYYITMFIMVTIIFVGFLKLKKYL